MGIHMGGMMMMVAMIYSKMCVFKRFVKDNRPSFCIHKLKYLHDVLF